MDELVQSIRDRLAERAHEEWCNRVHNDGANSAPCDCPYGDAPAAILAVLNLHRQDPELQWMCTVCGDEGQTMDCTYPCDTIRVIADCLGVRGQA